MTIVICCNKEYYVKGKIFFDSLVKNWAGRVCVLCIDFNPDKKFPFEYASCEAEDLPSYVRGWPVNRDYYVCCEGGDFFNYFSFARDELIIQPDADMIMQRSMSPKEKAMLEGIGDGEIGMSASSKPVTMLREEYYRLRPKRNYIKTNRDFPGKWGFMAMYCCGVIVARASTYKEIGQKYIADIGKMTENFDHHAAGQWLFNYHAKDYQVIDLGHTFHNASWFIDTDALEGDWLINGEDGQIVLFNHTKFLREYLY